MCLTIQDLAGDINTLCEQRLLHAAMKIKTTLNIWKEKANFDMLCEDAQVIAKNFIKYEAETKENESCQ